MAKFGELINTHKPVLIDFYTDPDQEKFNSELLRDVASNFEGQIKVFKISIQKNPILVNALKVKGSPTFMLYKNGEIQWRETGIKETKELISIVNHYL